MGVLPVLCACDITAHSLLQQHLPLLITAKTICSTACGHPTLATAEPSCVSYSFIHNISYSELEEETEQFHGGKGPAPGQESVRE